MLDTILKLYIGGFKSQFRNLRLYILILLVLTSLTFGAGNLLSSLAFLILILVVVGPLFLGAPKNQKVEEKTEESKPRFPVRHIDPNATGPERLGYLLNYYLDVLVEDPIDGTNLDCDVIDAIKNLQRKYPN